MVFRRRRAAEPDDADASDETAVERSSAADADLADEDGATEAGDGAAAADEPEEEGLPARPDGPWDSSEIDPDDPTTGRIDLGGLVVRGRPGMQARIEVDQQAQRVRAVTFLNGSSGLQLQAFAAPRSSGIWGEVRRDIAADAAKRGGSATELPGVYGPQLRIVVPGTTPDGKPATQSSRVVGIDGPRWMLRATFFGPAADPLQAGELADVLRDTIVVRGSNPMAPKDPLPLRMPTVVAAAEDTAAQNGDSDG